MSVWALDAQQKITGSSRSCNNYGNSINFHFGICRQKKRSPTLDGNSPGYPQAVDLRGEVGSFNHVVCRIFCA